MVERPKLLPAPPRDGEPLSISVHYSRLVAREIGARGKRLGELLRGTGVDPQAFMYGDLMLTAEQQTILALNALDLSRDAGLGLRLGRLLTPEAYGPLGFLVSASPDLQTAIRHFQTFLPTMIPFVALAIRSDGKWLDCRLDVIHPDEDRFYRATVETIGMSLCSIIESIVGAPLTDGTLFCRYPAPAHADRYAEFFSVQVAFAAPTSGLRIRQSLAATPNPIASRANYALALEQCRAMLEKLSAKPTSTANRVRQLLLSAPPGTMREHEVAESLFMSRRTLARRLSAEDTSFRSIQADILGRIAATQLRETGHSVDSIAALLNYHDASNFRRAFKSWFGLTPDEFRRRGP